MGTNKFLPEHIIPEQAAIHPALDWRNDVLFMGVNAADERRGVLTSRREILGLDELKWPICDRARNFARSPITENVARLFQKGYGSAENPERAYALIDVPQRLATYYRRFVVFDPPWWPEVLALWTLGTYLYPIFTTYPYLRISSPEPGCGKTLLGELIAKLSFNGELMVSPTEANIFRLAESERGTQVWDEVENREDVDQNRLKAVKSVLLNGYRSGGAVPRQERISSAEFKTVRFHVYVPRVLIGLSDLPEVVQQRVIELTLHRRSPEEQVERYIPDGQSGEEAQLREMCALYALTYCGAVAHKYRGDELAKGLERHLGQAGRFTEDLLLPLFAVCTAPLDGDERSRRPLLPVLRTLLYEVAPTLARGWNEAASTTPQWFIVALDILEKSNGMTPAQLARSVSKVAGINFSPEQFSHRLKKYGIHSEKENGSRVFVLTAEQIAQLRARYRIAKPDEGPAVLPALPAARN
jgi:hypothetical protein